MYESHWNLTRRPFDHTADAAFYFPCEAHEGALLKLRYILENGHAAACLAGASGVGKSLLMDALKQQSTDYAASWTHIVYPELTPRELLACVARGVGGLDENADLASADGCLDAIEKRLAAAAGENKRVVVVFDEAQILEDAGCLQSVRLLLNLRTENASPLTVLLVGQTSLLPSLSRYPQLEERLALKCLLRPLREEETASYVQHRLRTAGAERQIFDGSALRSLHHFSEGIPRRINRLADLALLIGYADELATLSSAEIESVAQELTTVSAD